MIAAFSKQLRVLAVLFAFAVTAVTAAGVLDDLLTPAAGAAESEETATAAAPGDTPDDGGSAMSSPGSRPPSGRGGIARRGA